MSSVNKNSGAICCAIWNWNPPRWQPLKVRQEEENVSSLLATRVINQCPKGYSTNYNSSSCIDVKLSCKNNTLEKNAAQIVARRHVEMPLQEKKFLQKKTPPYIRVFSPDLRQTLVSPDPFRIWSWGWGFRLSCRWGGTWTSKWGPGRTSAWRSCAGPTLSWTFWRRGGRSHESARTLSRSFYVSPRLPYRCLPKTCWPDEQE